MNIDDIVLKAAKAVNNIGTEARVKVIRAAVEESIAEDRKNQIVMHSYIAEWLRSALHPGDPDY